MRPIFHDSELPRSGEAPRWIAVDKFTTYLSIALAVCFACSAAFVTGILIGYGELGVLWYFVFTDFVNYAPPTILLLGLFLAVVMVLVGGQRFWEPYVNYANEKTNNWTHRAILGFGLLFFPLLVFFVPSDMAYPNILSAVAMLFALMFSDVVTAKLIGKPMAEFCAACMIGIFSIFELGYFSSHVSEYSPKYAIVVGNVTETVPAIIPIERGLVVIRRGSFELVPWADVHNVKSFEMAPPSPAGRPSQPSVGTHPLPKPSLLRSGSVDTVHNPRARPP